MAKKTHYPKYDCDVFYAICERYMVFTNPDEKGRWVDCKACLKKLSDAKHEGKRDE